jgi:hypothetical protein
MPQAGFFWRVSPSVLQDGIAKYGENALVAVKALADHTCQEMQDYARVHAPWHDRTGNARRGLFSVAEQQPKSVVLYLSHTVEYGIWLEIANGGAYQIIQPTIEHYLPQLNAGLRDLFSG